jgi:ArsR family transcriptional regulator
MDLAPADLASLEARASEVVRILRSLANERRLMIVCKLVECGEVNVGRLADVVGLSQSALSQHLAKLREDGVVATRRESQTIWYRIEDARVAQLLAALHGLFCKPESAPS